MKLFSTSSLNIPIMLKIIIKKVEPKIKILLLLVKELNEEVIKDFSVSFIPISFADDRMLINEGNNKKVTKNEIINPKVIIHPKSIMGLISLKIKDRNAIIVDKTVYKIGQNIF